MERPKTRNLSAREHCEWCEDGLAVAAIRPTPIGDGALEYAPCPWCELGSRLEFPSGKPGPRGERGARPSWGEEGYWRGRPPIVERAPVSGHPLPLAENKARWLLLERRMNGADVNPAVGVEGSDPVARMKLLAAEAAR